MDFNDLYHRHQVSLYKAEHASSAPSRAAHLALAEGYASQIVAARPAQAIEAGDPADQGMVVAFRSVEIVA